MTGSPTSEPRASSTEPQGPGAAAEASPTALEASSAETQHASATPASSTPASSPEAQVPAPGFRALMRNRAYALLWSSQAVSQLGDRFHWVAISLWVYTQTSSALSVSYALTALMLGPAVLGLPAGALIDRLDRKTVLVAADLVRAVLVALIPWLMGVDIRLVYLDLFLISCATTFFRPAVFAAIPQITSRREYLAATSFLTASDTGTEIVGPVVAGITVTIAGYHAALYVDAASYLISALFLAFLPSMRVEIVEQKGIYTIWVDVLDGLRFIWHKRSQMALAILLLGWVLSGFNSLQTPLVKGELKLSDADFGIFGSVMGIGFLAGSLLSGWYGPKFPREVLVVVPFLLWIASTAAAGFSLNAGMLHTASFWYGMYNMITVLGIAQIVMEETPQYLLGRVLAFRQVMLAAIRFVSMIGLGFLADYVGVRWAISLMALAALSFVVFAAVGFPDVILGGLGTRFLPKFNLKFRSWVREVVFATDESFLPASQQRLNYVSLSLLALCASLVVVGSPTRAGLFSALLLSSLVAWEALRSVWFKRGSKIWGRIAGRVVGRKHKVAERIRYATGPTSD